MVAIKDMEMPQDCKTCRFLRWTISAVDNVYRACAVNDMALPTCKGRVENCPLIDLTQYDDDLK